MHHPERVWRRLLPLYNSIGHLARRLDQKIGTVFQNNRQDMELTRAQFLVLVIASLSPGLEQAELAERASIDPATAGAVISRLGRLGLIRRSRSPRSSRGFVIDATAPGCAIIEEHIAVLDKIQNEVLAPLGPDERLMLLRLLSKLVGLNNSYHQTDAET